MREIKNLPDDATLDELLKLAKSAEEKMKAFCDLATEINEKWRIKLENRIKKQIEESQTQ